MNSKTSSADISKWLTDIGQEAYNISNETINVNRKICNNPEKYKEYSEFVSLYEKFKSLNLEWYKILLDEYSIKALSIMASLSNCKKEFEEWYECTKELNNKLLNTNIENLFVKSMKKKLTNLYTE